MFSRVRAERFIRNAERIPRYFARFVCETFNPLLPKFFSAVSIDKNRLPDGSKGCFPLCKHFYCISFIIQSVQN